MPSPRPFYSLTEENVEEIETVLDELIETAPIGCALVIDQTGYIMARRGASDNAPLEELAAIAAGCFTAFTMISTSNEMDVNFRAKGVDNIYFFRVNPQTILLALHNNGAGGETIRTKGLVSAGRLRNVLRKAGAESVELGATRFITEKLDEMFKNV